MYTYRDLANAPQAERDLAALITTPSGWVIYKRLNELLADCGVREVAHGERDNRTDGEVHIIYLRNNGETFELHGNAYDGATFVPVLKWAKHL